MNKLDIANALKECDWSNTSIGNKVIIFAAIKALEEKEITIPQQGSGVVNDACWKLHDNLAKDGPLTGGQFNNLKGYFYESLVIAMGIEK